MNHLIFIRTLIILAIQFFFLDYSFRNIQPTDTSTVLIVSILSILGFLSCFVLYKASKVLIIIFDTVYISFLFLATGGIHSTFALMLPVYIIGTSFLFAGTGTIISVIVSVSLIFSDYIFFENKNLIFSTSITMMLIVFGLVTKYFLSNYNASSLKIVSLEKMIADSQKFKIISSISSILAHEIKNPIASISGAVDMMEYELKNEDRVKLFNLIKRETARLVNLAEDFLSYSGPEKRSEEVIDLNVLINQICDNIKMHNDFKAKNLNLNINLSNNIFIKGDFVRISQVVENIMINALHATQSNTEISCKLTENNSNAIIEIADTGTGIAENIKDKIFEPFFTTKQKGTGLGLAIAKKIITAHNGSISVYNANPGAIFKIVLPEIK